MDDLALDRLIVVPAHVSPFKAYPRTQESSTEIRTLFAQAGVTLNPDARLVETVRAGLVRRNGFCHCRLYLKP